MVVGNGAREDALSWRLAASPSCEAVFAAPGNAGTASRGENWNIRATDGKALTERALAEHIDLVVIGPETAIAAGVGDRLRAAGIATFAPDRSSGRLESSKIFSKRFMERHQIPTARAAVVHSLSSARKALDDFDGPRVVKADGLAAGKGVVVAQDREQAREVIEQWYSGNKIPGGGTGILLEEKLEGRELSVFAIGDGRAFFPFGSACDYKRAEDGDRGPNTGGMGAYSPPCDFPEDFQEQVREQILAPALRGLLAEGEKYIGVLYCGLMWTDNGPRVIEFNARFGDPETQVIMPRVTGDFAALLKSAADGALDPTAATLSDRACAGVVIASHDYPVTSNPVSDLPSRIEVPDGAHIFWSASALRDGYVDASGGRVMTVTAGGGDLSSARDRAYGAVRGVIEQLNRPNELRYRSDIAQK